MQGQDQIPSPVVAKIESLTPVPTPDPSSVILAGIGSTTSAVDGAIQSLTGFSPADGGFSGVRILQSAARETVKSAGCLLH